MTVSGTVQSKLGRHKLATVSKLPLVMKRQKAPRYTKVEEEHEASSYCCVLQMLCMQSATHLVRQATASRSNASHAGLRYEQGAAAGSSACIQPTTPTVVQLLQMQAKGALILLVQRTKDAAAGSAGSACAQATTPPANIQVQAIRGATCLGAHTTQQGGIMLCIMFSIRSPISDHHHSSSPSHTRKQVHTSGRLCSQRH